MKKSVLFFSLFTFHFSLLCYSQKTWKLVWSDEFEGDTINRHNWTFDTGTSEEGWGNNELEYYTNRPENARVRDGNLEITARREKYKGSKFTSARMKTDGLQSFTYGKIEARIKLPSRKGLWPAFWMLGDTINDIGFPYCGEIDILEYINTENTCHGTMHWFNGKGLQSYGGTAFVDDKTDYHVYSVEWDSASITWFVDDKQYWKGDINDSMYHNGAFHHRFFILLNLAVGGGWPGPPKKGRRQFPDVMYVDYVRVYKKG